MKLKLVLLKNIELDYETVRIIEDDRELERISEYSDCVMLSEAIDVDFPELDKEEITRKQVAVIDKQIHIARAKSEAVITELINRKQSLLAIGHEA